MQPQLSRDLVSQAVLKAVWQRTSPQPVTLNSDRGTQNKSQEFQALLQAHGMVSSMSGVENCYDNDVGKSFFGLLKRERIKWRQSRTRTEARADLLDYMGRFYNRQRCHWFNQGIAPQIFVERHHQTRVEFL